MCQPLVTSNANAGYANYRERTFAAQSQLSTSIVYIIGSVLTADACPKIDPRIAVRLLRVSDRAKYSRLRKWCPIWRACLCDSGRVAVDPERRRTRLLIPAPEVAPLSRCDPFSGGCQHFSSIFESPGPPRGESVLRPISK